MSKCIVCSNDITIENDSNEHVIPNSIGGKLVIRGFLCRTCNSKAGDKWDLELSKQLNLFSLLLGGVKRDRGTTPDEVFKTISGREIRLANEGVMSIARPQFITEEKDGKTHFSFSAPSMKQAQQFVRDMCKKHPSLNQQDLMDNLVLKNSYLNGDALVFQPNFGGDDSGRSLVKTILAFSAKVGIDPFLCNKAIDYLSRDGEPNFGYYYSDDVIINRSFEKPMHCLAVHADPATGLVIGYLEYFGVWRIISLMSDCYSGDEIKKSYYIYPENSEDGEFDFTLPFDKEVLTASYNYEKYDPEILHAAFGVFLKYCQVKDREREQERIIAQAWNDALEKMNLKEGDEFTEAQMLEFSRYITNSLHPYMMSQLRKVK
ncbi:HNH endonuclease [Pantoea agglomerans pv. betae]|uniref:HNH endonuclease n=1 Tax=Enterobacter agglomerans TaxID=549 RepID=UPI000942C0DF|nr:HNH endonuclease [Pantoea agglomerans]WHU85416.1 HNH endonuclease [Pantoea agglomerans pv. betae]